MTAPETAPLVIALVAELSAARGERDAYRLVARAGIHALHAEQLRSAQLQQPMGPNIPPRGCSRCGIP